MKPTLLIMAAGIGSRYGAGIKQLAKMTDNEETIMDFSIFDAKEAGFGKVVFIIRRDIERDFRDLIGSRIDKEIQVEYVFQDLHDLPEGFEAPMNRVKPWGTVHALLTAKDVIKEPFVVINADDYYGKEAFVKLYDFLMDHEGDQGSDVMAMAGYKIKNTLSENGTVTRGICLAKEDGTLARIIESKGIKRDGDKIVSDDPEVNKILEDDRLVSMNMWAAFPKLFTYAEEAFREFLLDHKDDLETAEYVIPTLIDRLIEEDKVRIEILDTDDKWIGVTYKEDLESAKEEFKKMLDEGKYDSPLWKLR